MAKKKPRVNLTQTIQPQKGDLEKLFSTAADVEQASGLQLLALRLEAIRPDPEQPRRNFPQKGLEELSESIRQDGVIQPIEVTEIAPNRYMIVHGERRWRAAQLAGLATIPAVVRRRDYDNLTRFVRQLVENIQREDLNDVDRAAGLLHLRELLQKELDSREPASGELPSSESQNENQKSKLSPWDKKITWAKVGKRLGYSRQRIQQLIQLLKLPEEIKEAVRRGALSERDTRIYHGLKLSQQRELHEVRMAGELSASEARQAAGYLKEEPDLRVIEVIQVVRQAPEPGNESAFVSSFGQPSQEKREAIQPIRPNEAPLTADPQWQANETARSRVNAFNINRVHWARGHLSRMRLEMLATAERRELLNVLTQLQQDIERFIETLQAGENEQLGE
jgi:ParB-like chromosome segregation protein Spo0J